MTFWFNFAFIILALLGFKAFIIRGVRYGSTKPWAVIYGIYTILSLLIGAFTLIHAFSGGIIGLTPLQNFIIALMVATIICEGVVALFFMVDDLMLISRWIKKKFSSATPVRRHHEPARRRFLKTAGLVIGSFTFSNFLYGITKGKYNFKVFSETLTFSDLPAAFDGFKIVQFSDLHAGGFDSYEAVKRGFDLIQEQEADLILFTGDLVNDLSDEILPYKGLLANLQAPHGKYAVLGNHDYPEDPDLFPDESAKATNFSAIHQHHADNGFQLLNNANARIDKGGEYIRLLGVENWGSGFIKEGDLDKALEGCADKEFTVLMSHDPTHWEKKVIDHPRHVHLTLAGHTHGMQMGIEAFGMKWSPIQYAYKRWAGLYKEFNQYLYVNRGFGFMAFAGRVGIPPEITVITLKSA